jgi:hypothetical protein
MDGPRRHVNFIHMWQVETVVGALRCLEQARGQLCSQKVGFGRLAIHGLRAVPSARKCKEHVWLLPPFS